MITQTETAPYVDAHLYRIRAQLHLEHLVIGAELISPEMRLSDHLNSSAPSVDIVPGPMKHTRSGSLFDLFGTQEPVNKARILFVIPISEPDRAHP